MNNLNQNTLKVSKLSRKKSRTLFLSIFLLATIIRLTGLGTHPLIFHSTGQYKTAILARSYFLNTEGHRDDIARIPSIIFRNQNEKTDPRINEYLVYQMYRIAGEENLKIPEIFSILYWIIGGAIIYKIAVLLFNTSGALISLGFYLFFPFGINISQSIHRESLLNMFFLWGTLLIIKHFRADDEKKYFYSSAIIAGIAVYIKITVIFPLLFLILFMGIKKYDLKKYLFKIRSAWYFIIFFSIGTSFYIYNIFWNKTLQSAASSIIKPELLLTSFFWEGWFTQIGKVTGVIPFILAIILFFSMKKREPKIIIGGLFIGYIFSSLIFSYTTAANDNYHLALFTITAIILGWVGHFQKEGRKIRTVLIFTILIAGVLFSLWHQYTFVKSAHYIKSRSSAFFLVGEQGAYSANNVPENNIWGNSFEAGELIKHGINNILLSRTHGNAAMYYGKMYGRWWPLEEDCKRLRLDRKKILSAEELYYSRYASSNPKFFIITDLVSWEKQPGLREFLKKNFKLLIKKRELIIFDLRKKIPG